MSTELALNDGAARPRDEVKRAFSTPNGDSPFGFGVRGIVISGCEPSEVVWPSP